MQLQGKILRYLDNGVEFLGVLKENDTMVMPLDM
ncbi:fumarylacetoacetase, partial [Helicobacter didelphidarum]